MIRRSTAAVALAMTGLVGGCSAPAATPSQDPLAAIVVTPSVNGSSLVATGAFADFGVNGGGARQVRVRIVDTLNFGLRIATGGELALAEPPVVCLVGPYSAPDDAGLESPCWGEPDLNSALQAELDQDDAGHYLLKPGQPIDLEAQLSRGTQRCDYPPGEWQLEVSVNPLSDGATGARYLPDTPFDVPISQTGPLTLLPTTETRYCGLATAIVQQQGEPEISGP